MTDNEHESESDSPMPEDSQAEAWHEEQPPDDDFQDQSDVAVAATEESQTPYASPEEMGAAPKRGASIMIGVIVVGALFIGGLAYMQFKGSGKKATPTNIAGMMNAPAMPKTEGQPAAPAPAAPPTNEYTTTPTTAEADLSAIYNAGLGQTTSTAGTTVALPGDPGMDRSAEKTAGAATSSDVITTTPKQPQVNAAASEANPKTAAAAKPEAAEMVPPVPVPAPLMQEKPSAPQPAIEARLDDLSKQIDGLRKNMEQAPQPAANAASLESRLERIEQQIASLAQSKEPAPKAPALMPTPVSPETEAANPLEEALPPVTVAKPAQEAAPPRVKKATVAARPKKKQRKTARVPSDGGWVLRAATPDAAWLSQGASSPQLRQVKVGDTLPGVGKIRAIRQSGNVWEVVAVGGTIH